MSCPDVWSAAFRKKLSTALLEHAPSGPLVERHLNAAIAVTVLRPGKLVRPTLAYATMRAHGAEEDASLGVATAVEYFHLASLLLDDLSCMDDAVTRRGAACVHRVHGEATAILAALAFINRAYALIGFALATQPGLVRIQAQACLDACLGTAGLVGGQARDLRFGGSARTVREVSRIALGKTGAMLSLSLLLPALLAAPTPGEQRNLGAVCIYWSLAFQALDDVQDVLGSTITSGKTTDRDRALDRPNLALVLGVPAARGRMMRLLAQSERAVQRLTQARARWSYLEAFQRYFAEAAAPLAAGAADVVAA